LEELASALEEAAGTDWAAAGVGHVVEAIREVPKRGLRELRLDDPMDMGYTLKAMQVGLWCLVERPELEQGLIAVVSLGGDADTNGAVAGAALGACAGAGELPRRWLRRIGGADYLVQLADRLHALAGG
jgi:ADP-ribosylglycohydrolase